VMSLAQTQMAGLGNEHIVLMGLLQELASVMHPRRVQAQFTYFVVWTSETFHNVQCKTSN